MTITTSTRAGTSHGGATTILPTRTARRLACDRAAQFSSGTSIGLERHIGKLDAQRGRGAVALVGGREEHAPVVRRAFVDSRRVVVHERGLQQFRDGMDVEGGPVTNAVVHALAEDVFHSIEESFVGVLGRRRGLERFVGKRRRQLLEQLLLLLRQLLRRADPDRHEQVAMATPADVGHALAAHAERRAALGASRNR